MNVLKIEKIRRNDAALNELKDNDEYRKFT